MFLAYERYKISSHVKFILPYAQSMQAGSSERLCGHLHQLHETAIPKAVTGVNLLLAINKNTNQHKQNKQCCQLSKLFIKKTKKTLYII